MFVDSVITGISHRWKILSANQIWEPENCFIEYQRTVEELCYSLYTLVSVCIIIYELLFILNIIFNTNIYSLLTRYLFLIIKTLKHFIVYVYKYFIIYLQD